MTTVQEDNVFQGHHKKDDLVDYRYQIKSYIGAGGMQHVYKAFDKVLNRYVALKTPINTSASKRFLTSAKLSAKVNHPNVAKTLDYLECHGRQYLIEELVDGGDLDKILISKIPNIDPYLVARIFHNLAKGIAASHHVNVIHRDLKPSNIMVCGSFQLTEIKITDFGIATMAESEIVEEVNKGDLTNSTSKTVVGAIPYMAPEAISSPRDVTNKADIWSLGAMMYELLTGSKPFGSGLPAIYKIMANETRVYRNLKPQFKPLGDELGRIIEQCFDKDPNARPSADELVMKCSKLCYSTTERHAGLVREKRSSTTGFITSESDGSNVFFHTDSFYGNGSDTLLVGDKVIFSKYPSNGAPRAHPVVKIL